MEQQSLSCQPKSGTLHVCADFWFWSLQLNSQTSTHKEANTLYSFCLSTILLVCLTSFSWPHVTFCVLTTVLVCILPVLVFLTFVGLWLWFMALLLTMHGYSPAVAYLLCILYSVLHHKFYIYWSVLCKVWLCVHVLYDYPKYLLHSGREGMYISTLGFPELNDFYPTVSKVSFDLFVCLFCMVITWAQFVSPMCWMTSKVLDRLSWPCSVLGILQLNGLWTPTLR